MHKDDRDLPHELVQRREYEAREKIARRRRDELADFHEEVQAAENPDYVGNKIPRSLTGAHGAVKRARAEQESDLTGLGGIFGTGGIDARTFARTMGQAIDAIKPAFAATAAVRPAPGTDQPIDLTGPNAYVDERFEFGTTLVSQATRRALEEESNLIAEKMRELHASQSAPETDRRERELKHLAEKFEMYLHPMTKLYVHNYGKVRRIEERLCPPHLVEKFEVSVVRVKEDIGDTRKIKRAIADVYNEDPAEVQLNQSERAQQVARPVLPDGIRSYDP